MKPLPKDDEEKHLATLNAVYRIGRSFASEQELQPSVQLVTDIARELTNAAFGAFFYNVENEAGEAYMLYTISGAPKEIFAKFPLPRITKVFEPTFDGTSVVRSADITKDASYGKNSPYHGMPKGHLPVVSYLAVPVIAKGGEVLGGLLFGHPEPDIFDDQSEQLALAIAAQAAIGIENFRLTAKISQQARVYETALSNTPDLVYIFDRDGRFTYANKALLTMWGKTWEEAVGKNCLELGYEPWHAEMHEREIAEVIATKQPIRGEVPFNGTSGRRIYDYIFAPVFDAQGEVEAVAGTTRDVTERKEMEEALRQNEARLDLALAASEFIGIWDWDIANNLVRTDERFARLYSVDPEKAKRGTPVEDFTKNIHPLDIEKVELSIGESVTHGVPFAHEYRLIQPDGSVRWVVARGKPQLNEDGKAVRLPGVAIDITAQKKTEEMLIEARNKAEQQRRRYETVLVNTADYNYVFDLNGRFTYINKVPEFLMPLTIDGMIGKNFHELHYPPEQATKLQQQIQQVIDTKETIRDESPFTDTSRKRAYEYVFCPVINDKGMVEAVAGSTRDITEYKEANRRKDEFLAMLAHELRNPLAPISNSIHIMKAKTASEKMREEAAALVDRQIVQMTHLLNDLLDVSRVTQGKIELKPKQMALSEIITMAVESIQPLIDARKQGLQVHLPAEPIWLQVDPTRMAQVFSNLLNNAAKYTQEGGKIEIQAAQNAQGITVAIRDNGIGIPPEMQPRIFDLFSQVDSSMERSQGGLGIGLTLVRNLIEMHKGHVSVESAGAGKGSTFTVTLPPQKIEASAQPAKPQISDTTAPSKAYRVLVVDDNLASAQTLGWTFELLGHDMRMAHDGQGAIDTAKAYQPDVILLDIGLPGMNGYEVCEHMRRDPQLKNAIIIAQTGWGQKEHLQRSKEAGFDHHLVKPVRIEDLQKILDQKAA